jgi:transposase
MPAEYEGLRRYLLHRYPKCTVAVAYEAGFGGFWLHDALEGDGIRCEVVPPNKVTQEKDARVKNDKVDARRLAKVLENDDYKSCHVPDVELRQDRQISRCLVAIQKDLTRVQARIKQLFLWHHLSDVMGEHWRATAVAALRRIELPAPLRLSLDIYLQELETLLDCRRQLRRQLLELSHKPRYCAGYWLANGDTAGAGMGRRLEPLPQRQGIRQLPGADRQRTLDCGRYPPWTHHRPRQSVCTCLVD